MILAMIIKTQHLAIILLHSTIHIYTVIIILMYSKVWLADLDSFKNLKNPENGVSDPENLKNPGNRQRKFLTTLKMRKLYPHKKAK